MRQDQEETVRFLASAGAHGGVMPEVVETHGALVFLGPEIALKMKRAVRYDYMDLSTLERRETLLRRELELNRPAAPGLYRDVVPVTRQADGLALGGSGAPVEWVLRMARFPAEDELAVIADREGISDALAEALGRSVQGYHRDAPRREARGERLIGDILDELDRVFRDMGAALGGDRIARFHTGARAALHAAGPLLDARATAGHVRRCHGDLHLRNLVLIDGRPVPFDALEFDETLGTCDVLYDLAFLLMDLDHRGLRQAANIVLGFWLLEARGREDAGLAALPLFLAVRAAIRAMVLVQTDAATGAEGASRDEAVQLMEQALAALVAPPPVLLAVGGLSGSGKTTLARRLAPEIGARPGAVHLRSDLERKAAAGVAVSAALPAQRYTAEERAAVYRHMLSRAETLLRAGQSVLLDATFLSSEDRAAATALAAALEVPFRGLWLEAPAEVLLARVAARRGDASDADEAVVRAQLARSSGAGGWTPVDAGGSPEAALEAAHRALA